MEGSQSQSYQENGLPDEHARSFLKGLHSSFVDGAQKEQEKQLEDKTRLWREIVWEGGEGYGYPAFLTIVEHMSGDISGGALQKGTCPG